MTRRETTRRVARWMMLGIVVVLAIGGIGLSWLSARLSDGDQVARWLSEATGKRVEIGEATFDWVFPGPELSLHDVTILPADKDPSVAEEERSVYRFDTMWLRLHLLRSIAHGRLALERIRIGQLTLPHEFAPSPADTEDAEPGWPAAMLSALGDGTVARLLNDSMDALAGSRLVIDQLALEPEPEAPTRPPSTVVALELEGEATQVRIEVSWRGTDIGTAPSRARAPSLALDLTRDDDGRISALDARLRMRRMPAELAPILGARTRLGLAVLRLRPELPGGDPAAATGSGGTRPGTGLSGTIEASDLDWRCPVCTRTRSLDRLSGRVEFRAADNGASLQLGDLVLERGPRRWALEGARMDLDAAHTAPSPTDSRPVTVRVSADSIHLTTLSDVLLQPSASPARAVVDALSVTGGTLSALRASAAHSTGGWRLESLTAQLEGLRLEVPAMDLRVDRLDGAITTNGSTIGISAGHGSLTFLGLADGPEPPGDESRPATTTTTTTGASAADNPPTSGPSRLRVDGFEARTAFANPLGEIELTGGRWRSIETVEAGKPAKASPPSSPPASPPASIERNREPLDLTVTGRFTRHSPARGVDADTSVRIHGHVDLPWLRHRAPRLPLRPDLARWLERALVAGRGHVELSIEYGSEGLSITGPVSLEAATIKFQRGWPPVEQVDGRIEFEGKSWRATVERARISGNRVVELTISMPDFSLAAPSIVLEGSTSGTGATLLRFVGEAPFARYFGAVRDQLTLAGTTAVALRLDIPLGPGRSKVDGVARFTDASAKVKALARGATALEGSIEFTRDGLSGGTFNARYLGAPITLSLGLGREGVTDLNLGGTVTMRKLTDHLRNIGVAGSTLATATPLLRKLSGEVDIALRIGIPHVDNTGLPGPDILLSGQLERASSALPAPADKSRGEKLAFTLATVLGVAAPRFDVQVGQTSAIVMLGERSRGVVDLGAGTPPRPPATGWVVRGSPRALDLDGWLTRLAAAREAGRAVAAPGAAGQAMARPGQGDISIALETEALRFLGSDLGVSRIQATLAAGGRLVATFQGARLSGKVSRQAPSGTLVARLEQLTLGNEERATEATDAGPATAGDPSWSFDPRSLPPLDIISRSTRIAGMPLGEARLKTSTTATGLRIDVLATRSPLLTLSASGLWHPPPRPRTEGTFKARSDDLGALLEALDYLGDEARGGTLSLDLKGVWPGPPWAFEPTTLEGQLDVESRNGRLVNIRKGASGSLFGLLSLTALPRRLLLDFSDIAEKGLRYKLLGGHFDISGGAARSEDFSIDSEIVGMRMSGRIGLASRDYDQTLVITPKLSSSLPLAPIWLAEKVLQRKLIDNVFASKYRITGSWEDPQLAPVRPQADVDAPSSSLDSR